MSSIIPSQKAVADVSGEATQEYPYPEATECPYPYYEKLKSTGPVHKVPGQDAYFLAAPEDVLFAIDNADIFSNISRNPGIPLEARTLGSGLDSRTMLDSDPPTQSQHKQFILRIFNQKVFRECRPSIVTIVNELIDDFLADGKCDFVSQFAERLPELVIAQMFGLPRDMRAKISEWGRLETSGLRFFSGARRELQEKVFTGLGEYSLALVLDRQKNLGSDLLSQMIRAQIERDGAFEPEYLQNNLALIITAGLLTTSLMLSSGMWLLLQYPDQLTKVLSDRTLIPNMVEEMLRLESPAQWTPRRLAKDTEMRGVQLEAEAHVFLGIASANREPSIFANPDEFDVTRKNASAHIAFGKGKHFCMGAPLARLEGLIAFDLIFERMKNLRLADDNDFSHIDSPSFRGLKKLNIKFDKA